MEIEYNKDEMVEAIELSKSLDKYIDKLASGEIIKLAISSNSKPDVVMVLRNEYEIIKDTSDFVEALEIAKITKERVTDKKEPAKMISKEELYESLKKTRKTIVDDLKW